MRTTAVLGSIAERSSFPFAYGHEPTSSQAFEKVPKAVVRSSESSGNPTMHCLRNVILALALFGATALSFAFVTSYASPGYVEEIAKELIRERIEEKTRERIDALDSEYFAQRAESISGGYAAEVVQLKQQLSDGLPGRIAEIVAQMRNLDCGCRRQIESHIREGLRWRLASANDLHERLATLIRTNYMEISERLTIEFRIFTATNAVVLLVLASAAFAKPSASLLLLPVSLVLTVAAGVTGYFYLFHHDWLHAILFGEYVGFAYVVYLGVIFAFLSDLVFNRGRVTARILNFVLQLIGSAVSAVPC